MHLVCAPDLAPFPPHCHSDARARRARRACPERSGRARRKQENRTAFSHGPGLIPNARFEAGREGHDFKPCRNHLENIRVL